MENILNIRTSNYQLLIREVFLKVIGEKYRSKANENLKNVVYISYNNVEGIKNYREYLLRTKRDVLACEFFESIGVDITKFKLRKYDTSNYLEFEELIRTYFGSKVGFDVPTLKLGIKAFSSGLEEDEVAKLEQISFLNNYLFGGENIINEANYEEFKSTSVYKRVDKQIQTWISKFEEQQQEYKKYKDSLESLREYVEEKEKRLSFIQEENIKAIYEYIKDSFPLKWQERIKNIYKNEESAVKILGKLDDYFGFSIFEYKYSELLKNGTVAEKKNILKRRLEHFKNLKVIESIPISFEEMNNLYNNLMASDSIRDFIPPVSLRKELINLKKELYRESKKALLLEDSLFQESIRENKISKQTAVDIAYTLYKNPIFVTKTSDENDVYYTLLYYTIRSCDGGLLDDILIHEFIHLFTLFNLTDKDIMSGFDSIFGGNDPRNNYNDKYRLYERFNETLTDIITEKVSYVLHNELKIFILEEKWSIRPYIDLNTSSILRNLIYPFVDEFFDLIIESIINEDLNIVFNVIGKSNFEKLIDILNYIDNLVEYFKLNEIIKNNDTTSIYYRLYLESIEEIMKIYDDMKEHSNKKNLKQVK